MHICTHTHPPHTVSIWKVKEVSCSGKRHNPLVVDVCRRVLLADSPWALQWEGLHCQVHNKHVQCAVCAGPGKCFSYTSCLCIAISLNCFVVGLCTCVEESIWNLLEIFILLCFTWIADQLFFLNVHFVGITFSFTMSSTQRCSSWTVDGRQRRSVLSQRGSLRKTASRYFYWFTGCKITQFSISFFIVICFFSNGSMLQRDVENKLNWLFFQLIFNVGGDYK